MANRPLRVLVVLVTLLQMDVLQGTEAQNSTSMAPSVHATWSSSSTVTSSSSVKMAPSPTMQPTSSSVHSLSSSSTVTSSSSVKMAPSPTMQPTSSSVHSLSPSSTVTSSASVEMAFSTIQPSSSASVASLSPSSTVTSSPSVKMASSTIQPSSSASVASLSPSYTVMASSSSEVTASSSMQAPSLPSVLNPSPSSSVPASSSSTVLTTTSPVTTTSPANENMYPYGTAVGDFQDTRYYNDWRCIQFFIGVRGFPFYGKRHYKLHVCRNGLISFLEPWYRYWPYNFGQYWFDRQPLLAPYWSLIDNRDAFREGTSKLYFQIYQKGDDKPSTRNILRKAAEDVNKQCRDHKLPTEFSEASWVMVVTWVNIRHRYSRWWWNLRDLYNTFQAVLITNGVHSFVMYNYPRNGILWSAPDYSWNYDRYWNARSLPVVGINTGDYNRLYYNNPRSGRVNIVDIDDLEGVNIFKSRYSNSFESFSNGVRGRIFIRLEDSQGEDQARLQCINWYYSQNNVNSYLRSLEPCPCTWWQAWRDRRFMWTSWAWPKICFYSTFPSRHGWGQECCYVFFSWGWSSYLALGYPDGGTAHRYHKYYYPSAHNSDDAKAYQQCCVHSNMCWMYYQRRPSDTCSRYIPPRWSWFWGDPHFVTLDNKNYTFNGLGEFVMLDAKDGHFQLQARTKLAKGEGTATVFSGAVAKETDTSTVQVILSDNGTMEVSVDGKPFDITDLTNNSKQLNGSVSVLKPEKNCFEMSFPSGMSVNVCEKLNQLSIVAAAPDSFKNNTKGLLGTWNGDTDDDFTLPNGTVLPGSISSKDIHYKFGLAWQVTNSTTLFTYKPGENMNSFINASFQPMFVDDIKYANQSLKEEAERLCQGDVSCLFDVASTRDLEVGESTKQINSQLVNDSKKMSNEPPKIDNSSSVLYLTVNQNITIHVNATDPDGDDITFNISGIPSEATVTKQPNSITVSWKVTDNKLDIQYIVTDTNEAVSSIKPTIYLCACHHGGSCLKPNITDGSNSTDDKFIRMLCSCSAGYTGSNCESDIDACEANLNPCFPGVKCIDLPAPANMTTGYECGPCPNGYNGTGAECADIDECLSGNHGCSQNCGNTPGSFVCSCNSGYQLNVDRKTCDDVNECLPVSDCMHKCTNTKGSYTCSCNENFKVDPNNKKRCVPKQPCTVVQHGCQHVCYLTEDKQQKCACNQGYKLNDDDKTCSDIDECATNQYRCNQKCHNTKGSYTCSCVNGFELSKDNITCVDINECMRWTFNCSDPSQICENTQGSYKCLCEEGLYLINNKCTAIKPGGTIPPPPTAPTPKEPSKEETANAVIVTVANLKAEEWNKPKEDKFKEVVAGGLTIYCAKHESCHPTVKRAKRSNGFITYTADQVHLLPGFPMQIVSDKYPASSKVARIAVYVNYPPGVVLETQTSLKGEILVSVLNATRADIEKALNVTGLSIKAYKTEQPTEPSVKKEDNSLMYIIIGVSVGGGVLVILLIVLIVFCCRKPSGTVDESKIGHQNHGMEMDQTRSDLQSGEQVLLKRVQETNQDDNGNTKKRNSSESSHHSSRVAPVNENM